MSAETAWPRRPTPRVSPHLGSSSFSARPRSTSQSSSDDHLLENTLTHPNTLDRPKQWNLEGTTRLDPQKIARIAQAFGVNLTLHPPSLAVPPSSYHRAPSSVSQPPSPSSVGYLSPLPSPARSGISSFSPSASSKSKDLVSVRPPASLRSRYPDCLLPLHPTLKAQLEAVAREYGLPSTVGIVLFLVVTVPSSSEGDASAKRRKGSSKTTKLKVGKDTWGSVWGDVFEPTYPRAIPPSHHFSQQNSPTDHLSALPELESLPPIPRSSPSPSTTHRTDPPSTSLLSRSPSSLTPASLPKRKRPVGRIPSPSSALNAPPSPSDQQPFPPFPLRKMRSAHSLAPSGRTWADGPSAIRFRPPELRIVGSVEFGIDRDRAGDWWDVWMRKKGLEDKESEEEGVKGVDSGTQSDLRGVVDQAVQAVQFVPLERKDEGVQVWEVSRGEEPNGVDEGVQTDSVDLELETTREEEASVGSDDHSAFLEEDGYAPLEDDEDDRAEHDPIVSRSPNGSIYFARSRSASVSSSLEVDGVLDGIFPSDEAEWSDLRDSRTPGGMDFSARDLSLPIPDQEADSDSFKSDAQEITDLLAAHPTRIIPPTAPLTFSRSTSRSPSPIPSASPLPTETRPKSHRPTIADLTLTLDPKLNVYSTLGTSSVPSDHVRAETLSPIQMSIERGPEGIYSPSSDASAVELAYLRRETLDSVQTVSETSSGALSAALMGAFGLDDGENELVGKRGSALLMQDSLNDLERVVRSLSPRELSVPHRERPVPFSLGAHTPSLSPALTINDPTSDPLRTPQAESSGLHLHDLAQELNIDSDDEPLPLPSVWPAVAARPGSPLLDGIPLPIRKDSGSIASPTLPSFDPEEVVHPNRVLKSIEPIKYALLKSPSIKSPLSEEIPTRRPPPPPPPSTVPMLDNSAEPFPASPRSRSNSTKSLKALRGFKWGRSTEDLSSPPLPEFFPTSPRLDLSSSHSHSPTNPYLDTPSSHVNQFGQRTDLTPEMTSSGFGEPILLPSPSSSPRGNKAGAKKRFKTPFSPGSLFGSKASKSARAPMEISAPEIVSVNGTSSSPSMSAFLHRRDPSTEPRTLSGSPSTHTLNQPPADWIGSPPVSPTSSLSPRNVRRKPVPSSSPSIASLSHQIQRMSTGSEESTVSRRSASQGDLFLVPPPMPDGSLRMASSGLPNELVFGSALGGRRSIDREDEDEGLA